MTTMTEDVSLPLLVWTANRTVEMHTAKPTEDRPWAGRCAACRKDGTCEQWLWALSLLDDRFPFPVYPGDRKDS